MGLDPIELNDILHKLTVKGNLLRPQPAKSKVPDKPGLYSIFIDSIDALPPNSSPFKVELIRRATNLLYVGQAKKALWRSD